MKNETLVEIVGGCIAVLLTVVVPLGLYTYIKMDESNLQSAKEFCLKYGQNRMKKGLDEVPKGYGKYSQMHCKDISQISNDDPFPTEEVILQQFYNQL